MKTPVGSVSAAWGRVRNLLYVTDRLNPDPAPPVGNAPGPWNDLFPNCPPAGGTPGCPSVPAAGGAGALAGALPPRARRPGVPPMGGGGDREAALEFVRKGGEPLP